MKRKIAAVGVILLCFVILGSGTLAYFSAEDLAHNVITTGGIDILLIEKTRDETGILTDFPAEGVSGVMPGMAVSKIVSVRNVGESEAWIRIRLEKQISGPSGDLPTVLSGGKQVMQFSLNSGKWIDGEDGYYYYTDPVPAGQTTEVFFEEVRFALEMGNEYQNATANILIDAQAVQTANNGTTVLEAQGWPTEVTD